MIIQIRGTSGSGKTTAMRKVMAGLDWSGLRAEIVEGRRNPLYYRTEDTPKFPAVSVLGSYVSTCGGCDTIHGYEQLIALTLERAKVGHVIMEGLLLSEDSKQTLTLPRESLRLLFLSTPLETCLERIRGRREAKGNDKPLNVSNTSSRADRIKRAREKLELSGVDCRTVTADQAPETILRWLRNT